MAHKEWLIGSDTLDAYYIVVVLNLHDLIDELHRVAVRHDLLDAHVVHHRCLVWVVDRSLNLGTFHILAHSTSQFVIDHVTRLCSDYTTLDELSDEGEVANDVEELVACRLIVPCQRTLLDISESIGTRSLSTDSMSELVELCLFNLLVVDDYSIVKVAALDEVGIEERLNLTHEDESAGSSNLLLEVGHVVEHSILVVEHWRREIDEGSHREMVVRIDLELQSVFIGHLIFLCDAEHLTLGILFHNTNLLDSLRIEY